jgi:hypothetical protein
MLMENTVFASEAIGRGIGFYHEASPIPSISGYSHTTPSRGASTQIEKIKQNSDRNAVCI